MALSTRYAHKLASNNPVNPNKNVCALAVARYFGVDELTRYLHTFNDIIYAMRKAYTFRSVKTQAKRGLRRNNKLTVEHVRNNIKNINGALGFVVCVEGHVLAMNKVGTTIVDTDPVKGLYTDDDREVIYVYAVYVKS